jgi:peptidoglycan/LPS O-acetylase OafA/YrhL
MSLSFSLYLDAVRLFAALVVLFSHFSYTRFSYGDFTIVRQLNLGSDAVVLFFVLSGLVISYTVDAKDRTAGAYFWNRLTRLYSVALPAIVLTFVFDWAGQQLRPAAYDGWWYNHEDAGKQIVQALTFSNEWGLHGSRIGTNGPYWSLSYEFAYYLIYGAAVFMKGFSRLAALLLLTAACGPAVLLLLPVWLMGAGAYRWLRSGKSIPVALAWMMTLVPVVLYPVLLWVGVAPHLLAATKDILGAGIVETFLRFSDEFLWNMLLGLMAFLHLTGVAALCRLRAQERQDGAVARLVRSGAAGSFSLYLLHYPALQLVDAALPAGWPKAVHHLVLLGAVLGICYAVASITERRLRPMRAALHPLWVRLLASPG